jgi:hypothetical protein
MQCPLCNKDLGIEYASAALKMRGHIVSEHMADVDGPVDVPAMRCLCGAEYRGITTLCRHLSTLSEEESQQHLVIAQLGQQVTSYPRQRTDKLARSERSTGLVLRKGTGLPK